MEKVKREVERGRRGRGESGERGSSIMGCRTQTEVWQVVGWNVLNGRNKGEARTDRRTRDGYWQVRANEEEKCRCESDRVSETEKQFFWMSEHLAKNPGGRQVRKCDKPEAAAALLLLMFA